MKRYPDFVKRILSAPLLRNVGASILACHRIMRAHAHPILVYQMSKVGSSSVYHALKYAGFHPLHIHFLGTHVPDARRFYLLRGVALPRHMYVEALLRLYLKVTTRKLKIITLVRDPIGRKVSGSFQLGEEFGYNTRDAEAVKARLHKELMLSNSLEYCYNWFDKEIKEVFGIDVLAHPFDVERGCARIRGERADVLVLKLENLRELWPEISRFVGRELTPMQANVRKVGPEGDTYQAVRAGLKLPRSHVERLYDHRWMRHFYSEREVAELVERWSAADPVSPAD